MRRAGWVLLLLVAGLWSTRAVPNLGFCDADALGLIDASRLESPGDAARLFLQEAGGGQRPGIAFYRPLTGLTYGIDHLRWGLDARGYHIFDTALHAGIALLLFWTLLSCGLPRTFAGLGGLVFALHPVSMEVVPAIARRGDLLATGLLLVAVGATLRDRRGGALRWGFLAVIAAGLAPFAKETGYLAPLLVAAAAGVGWRSAGLRAGLAVIPALVLRLSVLGGVGGYDGLAPQPHGIWGAGLRVLDRAELLGWVGTNLLAVLAIGVAVALARSRSRVVPWAVAFGVGHVVLGSAAGGIASWYLYAPTVGWIAVLAAAAASPQRWLRAGSLAFALIALAGSPAWTAYPEWTRSSDLTRTWIAETIRVRAIAPAGPLVLAGIPSSIRIDAHRRFAARSAVAMRDLTLESALHLRGIDPSLEGIAFVHIRDLDGDFALQAHADPDGGWRLSASGPVDLHPPVGVDWAERDGWLRGPRGWSVQRDGRALRVRPGEGSLWVWDGESLSPVQAAAIRPR